MGSRVLRGVGGGGTQGPEQALQAQTGTQGNAMLRLGMDPQGFVSVLPKPKASSMFSKWLGLDLIQMLSQHPQFQTPKNLSDLSQALVCLGTHSSPPSRETLDRVRVDKRTNM